MIGDSFGRLASLVPEDTDFAERTHRLDALRRVLNGTIYNVLDYEFDEERNGAKEYVPLRQRAPSVRWNLCRIATQDSVALLFGEGRFPAIASPDAETRDGLAAIVSDAGLQTVMIDAATRGSVGSVAMVLRIMAGRVFVDVLDTGYLTPEWDRQAPDTLVRVTERRKVKGAEMRLKGYEVADADLRADFWFQRIWDTKAETWFVPVRVRDPDAREVPDKARSFVHDLGFCPCVWVRNLPGGEGIDGACTFRPGIETQIELEYLLSQGGRGLKYSADPLLLIREPAVADEQIVRSSSTALIVAEHGDAKLLEIGGTASAAVIEHARVLRHAIMEAIGGSRGDPDRMGAAQSGRALEQLHLPLIWLVDKLRGSYGDALLTLARMIVAVSARIVIRTRDGVSVRLPPAPLALRWPDWFDATQADRQAQAATLGMLVRDGIMSRETATAIIARTYGIADVAAEHQDASPG